MASQRGVSSFTASGLPGNTSVRRSPLPSNSRVNSSNSQNSQSPSMPLASNQRANGLPRASNSTPYQRPGTDLEVKKAVEMCNQILGEVRRGLDEQKKVKEEVRKVGHVVIKLEESFRLFSSEMKQHMDASFTIESSSFKDGLIREVAILFTRSLKRQPSRDEINNIIVKVLHQESRNKVKFTRAKTFCSNKLTDYRCEERRRILGNKPCESFVKLTTTEFVDRFMSTIKAPDECRVTYVKHLTLLRKFVREHGDNVKNDTYKKFRVWVDQTYQPGGPTNEEWEQILHEDSEYNYQASVEQRNFNEQPVGGFLDYETGENEGENGNDIYDNGVSEEVEINFD